MGAEDEDKKQGRRAIRQLGGDFPLLCQSGGADELEATAVGIDFELEAQDGQPLDEDEHAIKAMKESARQLGLMVESA